MTVVKAPNFFSLLLVATIAPFIMVPVGVATGFNAWLSDIDLVVIAFVFGSCHVAATSFFFFDKDAYSIIQADPHKFITLPIFLAVSFGLFVYFSERQAINYLIAVNIAYLFFHYQKQNFGLISFFNKGFPEDSKKLLNGILMVMMAAGVLMYEPFLLEQVSLSSGIIRSMAYALAGIGFIGLAVFFYRYVRVYNLSAMVMVLSSSLFFVPLFIYQDKPGLAFAAIAAAHGAQYLIVMFYTAAGTGKPVMVLRLLTFILLFGFILEACTRSYTLMGIAMGLTWGHYIIDARVWKLSRPDSRAYILSRLKSALSSR